MKRTRPEMAPPEWPGSVSGGGHPGGTGGTGDTGGMGDAGGADRPPWGLHEPERHRYGGIIFEFDPLIAGRLMNRARQLQFYGVAAAIVMMFVATVSWGISRRHEREKGNREQERRLRMLGQMSAVLAHEIRNPLASLKGNAQLLAERMSEGSSDRRKADRVVLEASRLEALTADLLDFVRVGAIDRTSTDPAGLLRACVEEVDPQGFDLDLRGAPERWPLDGARLHQVFTNLLRNARQASAAQGRHPQAALGVERGRLIVTIRDYGEGLPSGQEQHIFDPFFTTRTTGTGLGLAVARRIVELHGGELTAANHPEGGAVFRIILPGESA